MHKNYCRQLNANGNRACVKIVKYFVIHGLLRFIIEVGTLLRRCGRSTHALGGCILHWKPAIYNKVAYPSSAALIALLLYGTFHAPAYYAVPYCNNNSPGCLLSFLFGCGGAILILIPRPLLGICV